MTQHTRNEWIAGAVFVFELDVLLAVAMFLMLSLGAARAQHDHAELGVAGDFYEKWNQPLPRWPDGSRQASCCSQRDCYATREIRGGDGRWEYMSRVTRKWMAIPERLLESNQPDPRESPDGLTHICENNSGQLLCVTLGSGM